MVIKLYKNTSESNVLNKVITNEVTYNGTFRERTKITTPEIEIKHDASITGYNYCYIPDFNRYYFIDGIESINQGLWRLYMRCDVLMSFKADILNTVIILDHSEDTGAIDYLNSDVWENLTKDITDIITFPSGLPNSGEYILITAGG